MISHLNICKKLLINSKTIQLLLICIVLLFSVHRAETQQKIDVFMRIDIENFVNPEKSAEKLRKFVETLNKNNLKSKGEN